MNFGDLIRASGLEIDIDNDEELITQQLPRAEIVVDSKLYEAVNIEELLPNKEVLSLLHSEGRISIPPASQYQIINMLIASYTQDVPLTELSNRVSRVCKTRDMTVLGTILCEHSEDGKPLGMKLLEISTSTGDMNAELKYAEQIAKGSKYITSDPKLAIKYLKSLCNRNHPLSLYIMGLQLIKAGKEQEGAESIVSAANFGHPHASAQAGKCPCHLYLKGIILPQDYGKAFQYLKKASDQGVVESTFMLGTLYAFGNGNIDDKPNEREAFNCFLKAANQGLSIAQHNVADYYFRGDPQNNIKKDIYLAIQYWEMASNQNLQLSLYNLGQLYRSGYTPLSNEPENWRVKVNLEKALWFFERAAAIDSEAPVAKDAREEIALIKEMMGGGGGDGGVNSGKKAKGKGDGGCLIQ
ncbi:hypothetical protein HDU76_002706 [Blyttiomyces sp. JEL0837]|nr:hypothetical protein HDU76_002706 [Blyttiomyces sp. JEL0837]